MIKPTCVPSEMMQHVLALFLLHLPMTATIGVPTKNPTEQTQPY